MTTNQGQGPNQDKKGEKERALTLAISSIEKSYGKGSIMRLGEDQILGEGIDAIPSGAIGLDVALGVGGYPRGRIVEVYGPESSGKTTLTLHAVAQAQNAYGMAGDGIGQRDLAAGR